MIETSINMANFNYTDLHFFDKNGIELPISYQANYIVEIPNEYGDNALFYGLKDCTTNEITFIKRKSGNRFSDKDSFPCTISIDGNTYSGATAVVEKEKTTSTEESEYHITGITSLEGEGIEDIFDIADSLPFPTITLSSSLSFPRISVDLVETQSIYILVEDILESNGSTVFMKLQEYNKAEAIDWKNNYKLLFYLNNRQQKEFRFFTADTSELKWTDKIIFDFNSTTFKANIGFCAKEEGVYEETMYICLLENYNQNDPNSGNIYPIGAIHLQAEAVGEDERYRTLFQNFGIPDPIKYQEVFANTSLEEGRIDYIKLNENSKKLFLSYSEIFSYLGTYKALINAVNVLGYTDIFFKEWYKEIGKTVTSQGYITYDMKYHSDESANIINNIPIEERISLKKLNWISMVYRINKEMKNLPEDKWGFPQSEEVYNYNNEEIIAKLYYLKRWLEKYIIGLNCKIVDVSGEGIYFERYKLDTYGTFQQIYDWNNQQNLIPYAPTIALDDGDILDYVLVDSSVDVYINVGMENSGTIEDYKNYILEDFSDGFISSDGIYHQRSADESEDVSVYTGRTFNCLNRFESYELKATSYGEDFLFGYDYLTEDSAPIRITNNRIYFNPFDLLTKEKQSTFTLLPFIQLERANIRKIEGNWNNSVKYRVNPILTDDSLESYSVKDLETDNVFTTVDYVMLVPPTYTDCSTYTEIKTFSGKTIEKDAYYIPTYTSDDLDETKYKLNQNIRTYGLRYSSNNVMGIPMFSIIGYEVNGNSNIIDSETEFFLEILDGKMLFNDEQNNRKLILNFNYDEETGEQEVKINMIYTSDEFNIVKYLDTTEISNFIPGDSYTQFIDNYYNDPETAIIYDSLYPITVKNTGKFNIDVYAKDIYNNIFAKNCENYVYVHLPNFSMTTYTNFSSSNNEFDVKGKSTSDSHLTDNYCDFCIYNNAYMIEGFTKSILDNEQELKVDYPNYSYSLHRATKGDYLHFMNISDKYLIDGLDYEYSSTENTDNAKYYGYSFVLERAGMNNVTRVVEEYDEAALLSINNEYITNPNKTVFSFMEDLYNSDSNVDYIDVNLILYNELGNFPILQTYATMINENALPYAKDCPKRYDEKKYRLLIGEHSDRSYIWASLREHIELNLDKYITKAISAQPPVDITYIEDASMYEGLDELDDDEYAEATKGMFFYLDLQAQDSDLAPVATSLNNALKDSSIDIAQGELTDEELEDTLRTYYDSITDIIDSYDASALADMDSSIEMFNYLSNIVPNLSYTIGNSTIHLYEDVRSLLCLCNTENLDEPVLDVIYDYMNEKCKIEDILASYDSPNADLYSNDTTLGPMIYDAYNDNTTVIGNRVSQGILDETAIETIANSLLNTIKTVGNDITELYKVFVLDFYENYGNITTVGIAPIASTGTLKTLYESTNIKEDVQQIIMDTINEINQEGNEDLLYDLEEFIKIYTKILFSTCVYIGYKELLAIINNTPFVESDYNTLYASSIATRDDVLIDSYEYTIKVARGLKDAVFTHVTTDEGKNIVDYYLALTTASDKESDLFEKLLSNLTTLTAEAIRPYWITKNLGNGKILYAVASCVEGEEDELNEQDITEMEISEEEQTDEYADYSAPSSVKPGTLYYVKPQENVNEGLTFVEYFGEEDGYSIATSPKNVLPDLDELIKKPYISAYIQPTWKAQINISRITEENAQRLGFDDTDITDYLCIQYASSDFMWHFRKGEMIKLIFESLTNNEYVGQSSYEVVGYDTEDQVVIVKGSINSAYIRGEKHEVWAEILDNDESGIGRDMLDELRDKYSSIDGDIQEKDCQPFMKQYTAPGEEPKSYRLPVRRINGIWYYKVFYFVNGIPRAIETQKIDPQEKVNMYISYAHNAYVDYVMKAIDSTEKPNGMTELNIEYNNLNCRKMEFVDDTFVISSNEFDINEGLAAWMNSSNKSVPAIINGASVYSYTKENGFVPVNITSDKPNIVFEINFKDLGIDEDESYVQWKIYRMSPIDNSRKYMFESFNKILYLDYANPGIYDIEANVYDKYGNTTTKIFKGAYKVTS